MSFFDSVTQAYDDPIMALPIAFAKDPRLTKINLGIGAYQDENGQPVLLSCVKKAEKQLLLTEENKEYLPIHGDQAYIRVANELLFGPILTKELTDCLYTAQSVGGTSALRIGADFLFQDISRVVYLPDPTWQNHPAIFKRSGMQLRNYRYYNASKKHAIDFDALCEDICLMPANSLIVLHAVCHNPTGLDPTLDQWKILSALIKNQKVIPFFDIAYQGFANTLEKDAEVIRFFARDGHEMIVANSFSKNFGLYCERVGTISIIAHEKKTIKKVESQLRQIIRTSYSNPPRHGAKVIASILSDSSLKTMWEKELADMRSRIKMMREVLIERLHIKLPHQDWSFLSNQNGFFSFCGLNAIQVETMIEKHGVYMPSNGRINVAGLTMHNIDLVVEALYCTLKR